ncbi:MAG: hypothetical protein GKR87_03795 [Kiritimatiellae bacterium]|nr:hypothetical protein [Kiritimatiellia bacterium]
MRLGQLNNGQLTASQSNSISFNCVQRVDLTNALDTDADGIDDVYELQYFNPLNPADASQDLDSDQISNLDEYQYGKDPTQADPATILSSSSPAHGEQNIAVTRETIVYFSNPLATNSLVNTNTFYAQFGGQAITGRVHISADRQRATIFYDQNLPASAAIRVFLNGNNLKDVWGRDIDIDIDSDGTPGGLFEAELRTVTLTVVSNTVVFGRVFASELQLVNGSNEWVNVPLEGVTITVDGKESELNATTDSLGDFRLENTPVGAFFVHVNGTTVSNSMTTNGYYPNVSKLWTTVATQELNIGNVYLPLVTTGTLEPVSTSNATVISFPDSVISNNPSFADVTITIPAGSLQNNDGSSGTQVGIAPVDPDRLPGQLPASLNFPLVITVQADAPNFDTPAPVCFPNLPNPGETNVLPPGAKTALWSFDHDAGHWIVVGSMTIDATGLLACSDEGVGILAPGWHAVQQGSTGGGGTIDPDNPNNEPPCTGPGCDCENSDTDPVYLFSGEQYLPVTDLTIKGRGMDFVWGRKYRSKIGPDTVMGNG